MARVFVTGANGFVGSSIVRELARQGHRVTALVGRRHDPGLASLGIETRSLDLLDGEQIHSALAGGEWLVHCAARYSFWERGPEHIYRVNVAGTLKVLAAAREHGYQRIVYTSTLGTLTPSIDRDVETEESLFDLRRFHGHSKSSKVMAEVAVLREIARGLPALIVHPTTVLGENDRRPTPSGSMVVHFINGRMKAYVDTALNVVDVDDVAKGHVLALTRGRIGHQYILGGENLRLGEITKLLSELTGIPAPRFAIPPRFLLWGGRVSEWISNHITHRPPLLDVESTLHAMGNRFAESTRADKELGYSPNPARLTLARATRWFIENGYCSPNRAQRIRAHGALDEVLEQD